MSSAMTSEVMEPGFLNHLRLGQPIRGNGCHTTARERCWCLLSTLALLLSLIPGFFALILFESTAHIFLVNALVNRMHDSLADSNTVTFVLLQLQASAVDQE